MDTVKKHNKDTFNSYVEFTNKFKGDFRAGGHTSISWNMRRSLLKHMSERIEGPDEIDMLDIGCNNGILGRELCNILNARNINTNIDGIDFVEEAVRIAKEEFGYRSAFIADITDRQRTSDIIGKNKYHLVFCCEVFLYINPDDYEDFFTAVHSLLKPGGHFLFFIPNVRSMYHIMNKVLAPKRFNHYYKYDYDLLKVKSLLGRYGFSMVATCGSELLTKHKIDLNEYGFLKNLLSFEIAILAMKSQDDSHIRQHQLHTLNRHSQCK